MTDFHTTRRRTLQGLGGLILAAPLTRAWANEGGPSLNFLAVGDWGRQGEFHQSEVARRMGESAAELSAQFVVSVGDNFYNDGVMGVDDPAWRNSYENIYTAPSLQVPWYAILGNHDYRGNSQAQLDYSTRSKRWRLPSRWYQFEKTSPDGARVGFFLLDTSPMMQMYYADGARQTKVGDQKRFVPVQLTWLDHALATSRADWNIVIGHHPIYAGRSLRALPEVTDDRIMRVKGGYPELIADIAPILRRHHVPLYLNGHNHDLQHVLRDGTHYVCTGAGSKMADYCDGGGSDFCSLRSGFIACAANRWRLRVAYRDYSGAELHVVDIPRAG